MILRVPKTLQTDKGIEFKNKELEELCKNYKINQIFGPPFYSLRQGATEGLKKIVEMY